MVVATLNFTGRKRITLDRIEIDIEETPSNYKLSGKVDLSDLGLPTGSLVVEVYRQQYRERVSVEAPTNQVVSFAATFDRYPQASALLAEVKVVSVDPKANKRLLAAAKQIRPNLIGDTGGFRKGLLPFTPKDDMGQVLWVTDLSEGPVVNINSGIPNWNAFCRLPLFQSLVMPEITRDIAAWVWEQTIDGNPDDEDLASQWKAVFASFGADIDEYRSIGDNATEEGWISSAVTNFANNFRFLDKLPTEEEWN